MSNTPRDAAPRDGEGGAEEIDRRLMDENAEGQQEILDSAIRASEIDRQDPDSPERRERSFGVEDPSHSRGSRRRRS